MNKVEIRKAIQNRSATLYDCTGLMHGKLIVNTVAVAFPLVAPAWGGEEEMVPSRWGPNAGWQLASWGGLLLCWPRSFVKPTKRYGPERILVVAVRWGDDPRRGYQYTVDLQYRTDWVHGNIHVRSEDLRMYSQNEVAMAALSDKAFGVSIFDVHDQRKASGYNG